MANMLTLTRALDLWPGLTPSAHVLPRAAFERPVRCTCGGTISLDPAAQRETVVAPAFHVPGRPLERRLIGVTVAACNGCEFVREVR